MGVGIGIGVYVGAGVGVGLGVGRAVGVGVGLAWVVASIAAVTVDAMSGVGAVVGTTAGATVGATVGSIVGVASPPQAAGRRSMDTTTPQRNGFTGLFIRFAPMPGKDYKGVSQACENSTYELSLWQMAGANF